MEVTKVHFFLAILCAGDYYFNLAAIILSLMKPLLTSCLLLLAHTIISATERAMVPRADKSYAQDRQTRMVRSKRSLYSQSRDEGCITRLS